MGTDWIAATKKIKGYVDTYLAIANPTDKQKAALRIDLRTLDTDLAGLAAAPATFAPGTAPKVAVPAGLEVSSARGTVDLSSPSPDTYWYMRQSFGVGTYTVDANSWISLFWGIAAR